MKKFLAVLILITFVFGIGIATSSEDVQRAYFKVKNEDAKQAVKDAIKHEFRDNIIVLETSKRSLQALQAGGDLEFVAYDTVYNVADTSDIRNRIHDSKELILDDEGQIPASQGETNQPLKIDDIAAGTVATVNRVCNLSDYNLTSVNYGVKYMYGDMSITSTSGGASVRVAVIDTGANTTHPDIMSRIKYCKNIVTGTNVCDDTSAFLGGHGTGVSSVIAADSGPDGRGMWGMAPQADLYIINVCRGNQCYESDIAAGIYDAVNQNVNIISMSLAGVTMTPALKDAIDYAYSRNILLLAAAGNSGPDDGTILYPAAYYKVVAVGGINEGYGTWPNSARGINDGDYVVEEKEIEFGAPGTVILAANNLGCYGFPGGTSYATPHVSGLAAKIWDGNATSTRMKLQNAARLVDLDIPGDDTATGFGLPAFANINVPPVISNIRVNANSNQATITWDTDKESNSAVKYSTVSGDLSGQATGNFGRAHSVTINGLTPETTYYFVVSSTGNQGRVAQSLEQSFTTSRGYQIVFTNPTPVSGAVLANRNVTINATITDGSIINKFMLRFNGLRYALPNLLSCNFENTYRCDQGETAARTTTGFATGRFGRGVLVNSNDTLYYPSANNINAAEGTLMFWIKPEKNWSTGAGHVLLDTYSDSSRTGLFIWKASGANALRSVIYTSTGSFSINISSASFRAGTWKHVAITYGNGNMQVYVDGNPAGSATYSGSITSFNSNIYLGQRRTRNYQANATFDELKIYGTKLTNTEIANVYNKESGTYYIKFVSLPIGSYAFNATASNGNTLTSETRMFTIA